MSTSDIIQIVLGVLLSGCVKWLSDIARAIKALEKSTAVIAANSENLERRVSGAETELKEHGKTLGEIKTNCAMYHHHRRSTDPGE